MLYLFTGTDINKARTKAFAWVAAARAKRPDAPYLRLSADAITEASLGQATTAQGLFYNKSLVVLDDPFALKDAGESVLEQLKELQATENLVVLIAPKLGAAPLKKITAAAEKVFEVEARPKFTRGFNGALVSALASKNKEALWKEIVKARRQGDAPEMIHGLLHWKARDMMEKGTGAWGNEGARRLSRELIELLSDSRSGELPLQDALERFALSI